MRPAFVFSLVLPVRAAGLFNAHEIRRDEAFAAMRQEERFKDLANRVRFKAYLWLLERPERDEYQQPERVMQTLAFRPGERVADVGAGSGYFARRIARAVGAEGVVHALDLDAELLAYLEARAREEGLTNLRTRLVKKDDPGIPPGSVDTILMVDTLHLMPAAERGAYAKKLRAALTPEGRVVAAPSARDTLNRSAENSRETPPSSDLRPACRRRLRRFGSPRAAGRAPSRRGGGAGARGCASPGREALGRREGREPG